MRNNIWKVQATHPRKKTPKHTKKSENEKKTRADLLLIYVG